jgi:hypothetical protein
VIGEVDVVHLSPGDYAVCTSSCLAAAITGDNFKLRAEAGVFDSLHHPAGASHLISAVSKVPRSPDRNAFGPRMIRPVAGRISIRTVSRYRFRIINH